MPIKLIRELRMGPPKCWKTGAVVGTYPRPLLVLNFDQEGLDVITEAITPISVVDFETVCKLPVDKQPPLSVVDFCDTQVKLMTEVYVPQGATKPFKEFVETVNRLVRVGCPWKTIVLDSASGLGDAILAHIAATNASSLASALKWAPMIGGKVHQCMGVMTSIQSHVVFIFHASTPEKDETTQQVEITPLVASKWARDRVGSLVSQYFYQCIESGKPIIHTRDNGYVRGIGCRWPNGLAPKVGATFKDIYGKEL